MIGGVERCRVISGGKKLKENVKRVRDFTSFGPFTGWFPNYLSLRVIFYEFD